MGKWYGKIGYAITKETSPGVYTEEITERSYYGDIERNRRMLQSSGGINDDINVATEISIVADPFARENFHAIRYVEFMGTKWKATSVEPRYPRLIVTMGGVYNGQ